MAAGFSSRSSSPPASGSRLRAHVKTMNAGREDRDRPRTVRLAEVVAYLVDWNLTDADGRPVVIRGAPTEFVIGALDNLDADGFDEIKTAITKHIAALEEEKKIPATASASPATSDSAG